jgi:hypothetical protein
MRYRLSTLLVAIAGLGPICLALRSPNAIWASGVFTAALISLLTCVLLAIYRRGRTRAFAVGYLIFGGSLLVLLYLPAIGDQLSVKAGIVGVADYLYRQTHGQVATRNDFYASLAFYNIFYSLALILFGLVGGVIASLMYKEPQEGG